MSTCIILFIKMSCNYGYNYIYFILDGYSNGYGKLFMFVVWFFGPVFDAEVYGKTARSVMDEEALRNQL